MSDTKNFDWHFKPHFWRICRCFDPIFGIWLRKHWLWRCRSWKIPDLLQNWSKGFLEVLEQAYLGIIKYTHQRHFLALFILKRSYNKVLCLCHRNLAENQPWLPMVDPAWLQATPPVSQLSLCDINKGLRYKFSLVKLWFRKKDCVGFGHCIFFVQDFYNSRPMLYLSRWYYYRENRTQRKWHCLIDLSRNLKTFSNSLNNILLTPTPGVGRRFLQNWYL